MPFDICAEIVELAMPILDGKIRQAELVSEEFLAEIKRVDEKFIQTARPELWHTFSGSWFIAYVVMPEEDLEYEDPLCDPQPEVI